jgi:hypothetical protein
MTRTDISAHRRSPHGSPLRDGSRNFIARQSRSPASWMAAAFLISLVIAAITLAMFGAGERGTALALRLTGRWMFVLFWPAYAGGALKQLFGPRFDALARRGREFGLAFASALVPHIALVLWIIDIAADQRSPMILFWAGTACTCLLALSSLPRLRDALGPRLWRLLCAAALDYIALLFALDLIFEPLRGGGSDLRALTYLPFALVLIGGAGLRLAAFAQRRLGTGAAPR